MLETIMGSKTKVRILRELSKHPGIEYTIDEISRKLRTPYGSIHPAVMSLVGTKVLLVRKAGRSPLIRFNDIHVLARRIRDIFQAERLGLIHIARDYSGGFDKTHVKNILVFGSIVKGEIQENEDIPLLIIHDEAFRTGSITRIADQFHERYNVIVQPIFIRASDMEKRVKDSDSTILNLIEDSVVLYGDPLWLKALRNP
jgi:predicted nucleotidyltransferase